VYVGKQTLRLLVTITPEIRRWLDERKEVTGATIAEIVRRELQKAMAADTVSRNDEN
jgi:hypothetical protein